MIIRVDNKVHLMPLGEIPGTVQNHIRSRLTFPNPAFLEADKRGFWTGDIEQEIKGYQVEGDTLVVPRGFTWQLVGILHRAEVQYRIEDRRRTQREVDFTFKGDLHDFQVEAVKAMEKRDFGTLAAPTGSGKTVMALAVIAARRQPALVVVHTNTKNLTAIWTASGSSRICLTTLRGNFMSQSMVDVTIFWYFCQEWPECALTDNSHGQSSLV